MAVNDIYQANIVGTVHGQMTVNTLHYQESITGSTNAVVALTAALQAGIIAALLDATSAEWNFDKLTVQKILPLPPLLGFEDDTNTGPGLVAGESLPSSVAVVCSKRTSLAGRAFRGRCYFAGVPASHEIDSQLTSAALILWQQVADDMAAPLSGGGFTFNPIVFHRDSGTGTVITSGVARQVLRNQRRRQVGKGS